MVHAKYPDNPLAMTFYGSILYYELGRQDEAVMLWKRASVVNDKLPEPINELYIHYFHVGDYANGWEAMEKVRKLAPDDPDVLFNLAQTFLTYAPQVKQRYEWNDKKVYEEAMKCSKKAAEKLPQDFQVLQDYANNFYAAENFGVEADWKDALEAWSKARAYAPNEYNVFYCWLNEARCAIRKGDKSHATTALGEALKIEPESKAANNLLATLDSQIEKHAGTNKSNDAKKSNEKKPKREKKDRS